MIPLSYTHFWAFSQQTVVWNQIKTIMDQFAQSVVYSHDQERKKEKWTLDSVEWNLILAFATKNSLAREKKNRKNVIYNSALIVTARSEKNLGSYHFRATEK